MHAWHCRERSRELTWLYQNSEAPFLTDDSFHGEVLGSEEFWIVLFSRGMDCGECKLARTNILRLSAGVKGLAKVGTVDCSRHPQLCAQNAIRGRLPCPRSQPLGPVGASRALAPHVTAMDLAGP